MFALVGPDESSRVPTNPPGPVHVLATGQGLPDPFDVALARSPVRAVLLAIAKSGAETDVRVRVRARVVQVAREHPGIARVVPIAATIRKTLS